MRTLVLAVLVVLSLPSPAAPLNVYDDSLKNGFADWSWATHSLSQTVVKRTGASAISFEPDGWQALYLHRDAGIDVATYDAIELWIHGGATGGQAIRVAILIAGGNAGDAPLSQFVAGGVIPAGAWVKARIPFASLGQTSGILDGFWLQDDTGGNQAAAYVDDVVLTERVGGPVQGGPVAVAIDPGAQRHPIDPRIYGVNFGTAAQLTDPGYTVRRWGGNATTRYSWEHDITNLASDWFFYNVERDTPNPATLPNGSTADVFIDETRAAGKEVLLTVPTIGWVPIDRTRRWGFSVGKYGAQQKTECTETGFPFWCQPDAGNGSKPNGTPITGNDPHDTSREIGPDFVTRWMDHIRTRSGSGLTYYALDNEPTLWNSTHRDVHPGPLTYDELWQRTSAYAAAIKAKDPNARIFGPAEWGWCAYFGSAADNCIDGPDRQAHGGKPLLAWYLEKVKAHQQQTGVRLVDYLDIHYYPQGTNVALSSDESASTAALRLRSIKDLYDPAYTAESWIGEPARVIPRMKEWIAQNAPGTKLAITEYSWGNDAGPSSALAQAEVLAVFGREGVDLATRWVAPAAGSKVEDAFRLYLSYDGAGARVTGDSVQATSSDKDAVGAYAVQGAGKLFVLLFNKDTAQRTANVTVAGGVSTSAALYRFDPSSPLAHAGVVAPVGGALALALPPRSATLAVVLQPGACAVDAQPPIVTAPSTLTINQSVCVGAVPGATLATLSSRHPAQLTALQAFLTTDATATDDCAASPARQTTLVGGAAYTDTTLFGVGDSTVTFRFLDGNANLGQATATLRVLRQGDLDGDGDADVFDDLILQAYLVGNVAPGVPPFNAPLTSADANGDGVLNIFDVVLHAGFLVGNVPCLTP